MEIVAVSNQKGGVGKTTTTIAIADQLAKSGAKVLMLDLDPQGSLTAYFQLDPDEVENTVYQIFDDPTDLQTRQTGFDNLDIVPASSALANLEKRAETLKGKGLMLKTWLATLSGYDYVVLDTPPALGMLMINALAACDRLVVPVQTDHLALKGLERMIKVLEMLEHSGRVIPYQILPTMFDQRTNASSRALQVIESTYAEHFDGQLIPVDTKFREASRLGVPPSFLFAGSHGVVAYRDLVHDWFNTRDTTTDSGVASAQFDPEVVYE